MPYMTVPELQAVLSHDGQHTGTAATLPPDVLQDRLDAAQGQIDSMLAAAGYGVPFEVTPAPPLVRDMVGAVAAYLADLTYRRGKAPATELDPVIQRYRWALSLLDAIAKGTALIPGVPPPGDNTADGTGPVAVVVINPNGDGSLFGNELLDMTPRSGPWWWD